MDPHHHQRHTGGHQSTDSTPGTPGGDHTPGDPGRDAPDGRTPAATDRQTQYSTAFTMIPPNESRRREIITMAQIEEEELQRWKEANRAPAVHLNPERLGGNASLAGARQRQLTELRCSQLQKKLRKEELDKRRRQEEEQEYQKKKDEAREKAERLKEKQRQEEQRRREQLQQDRVSRTESFLQRFERTAPAPPASSSATHTSSRGEAVESKSVRDVQLEHRRVNSAFLDKLEGQSRGSETETKEAEDPCFDAEDFRHQPSNRPGHPAPDLSCSDWAEEAGPEPDYDWAVMRLKNSFPDCSRVFLEDILDQCNGDYEQAYTLLNCTMN